MHAFRFDCWGVLFYDWFMSRIHIQFLCKGNVDYGKVDSSCTTLLISSEMIFDSYGPPLFLIDILCWICWQ